MRTRRLALWRRAEEIFHSLLEQDGPGRERILEKLCEREPDLARAVRELLEADDATPSESTEPDPAPRYGAPRDSEIPDSAGTGTLSGGPGGTPSVIDGYHLLHPLGRGGMGTVFLAERDSGEVKTRVALKLLDPGGKPRAHRLFLQEARILARLEHPNIARFLDRGIATEGTAYLVLEYVEGLPLPVYCDQRRLSLAERVKLMIQVCDAVQFAHQNLVIHRDLKPAHVLVTDGGQVKLLDFGIAKDLRSPREARTTTGEGFLTPVFASPEQIAGKPVSTASDIYTLGLVLCQLLCGGLPHRPEDLVALGDRGAPLPDPEPPSRLLLRRALEDRPDPEARAEARGTVLRRLRRSLRGDLDTLVLRCLGQDPRSRYPSVAQLAEDLQRYLDGRPILARRPSLLYRASKLVRRRPAFAAALVLAVSALVGYATLTARHRQDLTRERDRAVEARQEAEQAAEFLTDTFRLADVVQRIDLVAEEPGEITVAEALDYGAERLGRDFEASPRLQARLLSALGEIYANLGRGEEALPLLQRSLALRRSLMPRAGADVAETLAHLGNTFLLLGRMEEAERFLRSALVVAAASEPPVHDEVLGDLLAHLGHVFLERHEYEAAEPVLRRALTLRRQQVSEDPRAVAESLSDLGNLLWLRNELGPAASALEESLDLYQSFAPGGHPGAAYALQTLAFVQAQSGQKEASKKTIHRAVELRKRLQGLRHPDTLAALAGAGELLFVLRDFPGAEAALREVLALERSVKGETHPDVALDLHSLGLTLFEQGRLQEAETLVREALAVSEVSWGPSSPVTFSQFQTLSQVLLGQGKALQAEGLLRRVLEFRLQQFPPSHHLVALTRTHLASVLVAQGRAREALSLARQAAESLEPLRGRGRSHGAYSRAVLGSCLASTGAVEQGRALLEESLARLEELHGPEGRTTKDVRRRLEVLLQSPGPS